MAKELELNNDLLKRYGPNLNYTPPGGWEKIVALRPKSLSRPTAVSVASNAAFN
jgi:hypothetical protein